MVADSFTGIYEHPSPFNLSFILFREYMNPYIMRARRLPMKLPCYHCTVIFLLKSPYRVSDNKKI